MSDRMTANIYIGGTLREQDLADLVKAAIADGVDADGIAPRDIHTPEDLLQCCNGKGFLHFWDHEAAYGELNSLEQTLVDLGLPYNRHSDGYYGEYNAELARYRPNTGRLIRTVCVNEGDPVISADNAAKAYAALKRGNVHRALDILGKELDEYLSVPKLPKFKITPLKPGETIADPANEDEEDT